MHTQVGVGRDADQRGPTYSEPLVVLVPVLWVNGHSQRAARVEAGTSNPLLHQVPGPAGLRNDLLIQEVAPGVGVVLAGVVGADTEAEDPAHGEPAHVSSGLLRAPVQGHGQGAVLQGVGLEDPDPSRLPGGQANRSHGTGPGVATQFWLLIH